MTEQELKAIKERWEKAVDSIYVIDTSGNIHPKDHRYYEGTLFSAKTDISALLAEVQRLNDLLGMRCANCHLRKESEVADK